jgi:hypothetical protein
MNYHKSCPFQKDIDLFFTLRANDLMAGKFFNHIDTCRICTIHIQNHWTERLPDWLRKNPATVETSTDSPELKAKKEYAFRNLMLETISRDIQSDLDYFDTELFETFLHLKSGLAD